MDDQIKEELARLIANMNEGMKKGGKLVMEEIPPALMEMCRFDGVYGLIAEVCLFLCFLIFLYMTFRFYKKVDWHNDDPPFCLLAFLLSLFGAIGTAGGFIVHGVKGEFIRALVAPKYHILEYLRSIL
jgi:uncharacterized membrane protein